MIKRWDIIRMHVLPMSQMWAVALQFFTRMLEVAGRGEWDVWGDTFHRFWFGGERWIEG